jgi:hypothetical protein
MVAAALLLERSGTPEPTITRAWLLAVGGIRGAAKALAPGLVFLGLYVAGVPGNTALITSASLAAAFVVISLIGRSIVAPALLGLAGVIAPVIFAVSSGHVIDSFLPHLINHTLSAALLWGSVLVRRPAIGIAAGILLQDKNWRKQQLLYRRLRSLTLLWASLSTLRLITELPLYLTHQTTALIIVTLILGLPLSGPLALLTWWNLRLIVNAAPISTPAPQRQDEQ